MAMRNGELYFPEEPKISPELEQCLKHMLRYSESERMQWHELFEHELFDRKALVS